MQARKKDDPDKDLRLAVGQGFRLGAEVFLDFHKPGVKTDMNAFRKSLLAIAPPQWYADSRAFGEFLANDLGKFKEFAHVQKAVLDRDYPDGAALMALPMPAIYKHGSVVNRGAYLRFLATGKREYFDLADRRTISERELPFYVYLPVYDARELAGFFFGYGRWNSRKLNTADIPSRWPTPAGKPLRDRTAGCFYVCGLISYVPMMDEYLSHYLLTGERASLELARGRADDIRYAQYMMEPSLRGEDGHEHWRRVYGKATLMLQQYYDFTRDPAVLGDLNWMKGEYLMKPYPNNHYPVGHDVEQAAPYELSLIRLRSAEGTRRREPLGEGRPALPEDRLRA